VPTANPSVRGEFRKNLEERLERASSKNSLLIVSWELSEELDRAGLVCRENAFDGQVIEHVAASLIRLLGVGRRLGLVDRQTRHFTLECFPEGSTKEIYKRTYTLD
jgi:hypothetical protein